MKELYYRFINRKFIDFYKDTAKTKYKECLENLSDKVEQFMLRQYRYAFIDELRAILTDRMNALIFVFEYAASERKITEEMYDSEIQHLNDDITALMDLFIKDFVNKAEKFANNPIIEDTYLPDVFLNEQGIYNGDEMFFAVYTFDPEIEDDGIKSFSITTYYAKHMKCYVHLYKDKGCLYGLTHNGERDCFYVPVRIRPLSPLEKSEIIFKANIDVSSVKEKKQNILKSINQETKPLND